MVWILVLKAHGALFLQVHSVDERHRALVPVGLQVVSLRNPCRTAKREFFIIFYNSVTIHLLVFLASYSHTCYRWACCLRGDWFPGRLPDYWIQEASNPIGRSGCRCQENSFLRHTGYNPEQTSPGTPQPCTRKLRDKMKGTQSNEKNKNIRFPKSLLLLKSYIENKTKWQRHSHADSCSSEYNIAPVIKELNLHILLHAVSLHFSTEPVFWQFDTLSAFPHSSWSFHSSWQHMKNKMFLHNLRTVHWCACFYCN